MSDAGRTGRRKLCLAADTHGNGRKTCIPVVLCALATSCELRARAEVLQGGEPGAVPREILGFTPAILIALEQL